MTQATDRYTVFENLTGKTRFFGYLGSHGMRLQANEVVTIPGDVIAVLYNERFRDFQGLLRDLQQGTLRVQSRPVPVLFDTAGGRPVSFQMQNGFLGFSEGSAAANVAAGSASAGSLTGDALITLLYGAASLSSGAIVDLGSLPASNSADLTVVNFGNVPLQLADIWIDETP